MKCTRGSLYNFPNKTLKVGNITLTVKKKKTHSNHNNKKLSQAILCSDKTATMVEQYTEKETFTEKTSGCTRAQDRLLALF